METPKHTELWVPHCLDVEDTKTKQQELGRRKNKHVGGREVNRKSLYLLLSFTVNLTLL